MDTSVLGAGVLSTSSRYVQAEHHLEVVVFVGDDFKGREVQDREGVVDVRQARAPNKTSAGS